MGCRPKRPGKGVWALSRLNCVGVVVDAKLGVGSYCSRYVRGRLRGETFTGVAFRVDFGDLGDVGGAIGETPTQISNEIPASIFQGSSPVPVPSKVPNVPQVYPLANGSTSGGASGSSDAIP